MVAFKEHFMLLRVYTIGAYPGGDVWGGRPPKAYENCVFYHDFEQFRKHLSRYMAIVP